MQIQSRKFALLLALGILALAFLNTSSPLDVLLLDARATTSDAPPLLRSKSSPLEPSSNPFTQKQQADRTLTSSSEQQRQRAELHKGESLRSSTNRLEKSAGLSWGAPETVVEGRHNEYPDIAIDGAGRIWMTWLGFASGQENVYVRFRYPSSARVSKTVCLGNKGNIIGWPAIKASGKYAWVSWAEKIDGHFTIQMARFYNGRLRKVRQVSDGSHDAIRPTLTVDSSDTPWVAWEERRENRWAVVLRRMSRWLPYEQQTVDESGELNLRPTLAPGRGKDVHIAWDHYENGAYNIRYRLANLDEIGPRHWITKDRYLDQAPTLLKGSDERLWLAWHTNRPRNPSRQSAPYAGRALELVLVEKDGPKLPSAGPPPTLFAVKDRADIPDCLEFPALAEDPKGRIFLFARRGQGYMTTYLGGSKWSTPVTLSEGGWGGRGRNIHVAADSSGTFHVIARWLKRVGYGRLSAGRASSGDSERPRHFVGPAQVGPRVLTFEQVARSPKASPELPDTTGGAPNDLRKSGPLVSEFPSPTRRPFFGDLHTHSVISDGTGDPDEIFTRSRDAFGQDLVAVTDHDVSNGNRMAPSEWAYIRLLTEFFNRPGKFVTIPAYEWTSRSVINGGCGHRNVYFPTSNERIFGSDKEARNTLSLFNKLRPLGAFAIPHHTSWTGTDWNQFDPDLQPLFEVISVHGNSEIPNAAPIMPRAKEGGTYAVDGLKRGLQFGFVGGSDGHGVPRHYGVSRQEDVWTTGLTGVYAANLDRASLLTALKNRRTFATSGQPIALWIGTRGFEMGDEIDLTRDSSLPREFSVAIRVRGSKALSRVDWLRDGQVSRSWHDLHGPDLEASATITAEEGTHFYYVRVTQVDDAMAWSSPIWIHDKAP